MAKEVGSDVGGDAEPVANVPHRKPPPENPEGIRLRSLVIFSFWAVVLFLGLPVWWWTTSIHRARLPLRRMNDWADGKVQCPRLSFETCADLQCLGLQTYLSPTNCH